jgi:2,3-diaminopropionate biosynthesis protein SbnA
MSTAGPLLFTPSVETEDAPGRIGSLTDGVLSAVGGTPLVRLRRFPAERRIQVHAKLEGLNPGGSIKDRAARAIIEGGLRDGSITPDTVIIEQSSGNMGVGLAQVCRYHGLRFICVVDARTTSQNVRVLRSYGVELEVVEHPDPATGEYLPAKTARIRALLDRVENSIWLDQYGNARNPDAHFRTTMHEIATALEGRVDYLFVGVSTCGTLRGCWRYIQEHGLDTRIIAVDAVGSRVSAGPPARRLLPGLGTAIDPPFYDPALVHDCVCVTDRDSVAGCRWLVRHEAILAGGSSGGIAAAMHRYIGRVPDGATCVLVLPDRGDRYLDTIYNPEWVQDHMGEIDEL